MPNPAPPDEPLSNSEIFKIFEALGLLTVNFSSLDTVLHKVAWTLIGDSDVGRIVTAGQTMARVEKMVVELARSRFGEDDPKFERLKTVIDRVGKVRVKRNEMVHSMWLFASPDAPARSQLKRRGFSRTPNVSVDDIGSVTAET